MWLEARSAAELLGALSYRPAWQRPSLTLRLGRGIVTQAGIPYPSENDSYSAVRLKIKKYLLFICYMFMRNIWAIMEFLSSSSSANSGWWVAAISTGYHFGDSPKISESEDHLELTI